MIVFHDDMKDAGSSFEKSHKRAVEYDIIMQNECHQVLCDIMNGVSYKVLLQYLALPCPLKNHALIGTGTLPAFTVVWHHLGYDLTNEISNV